MGSHFHVTPLKNCSYITLLSFLLTLSPLCFFLISVILHISQPAYSIGPLSAHLRNAIQMAFRWRVDSGPPLFADRDYSPISIKYGQITRSRPSNLKKTFLI